ncbi:MAG: metal ABC transporter permease [Clostridia bacterium]|nr:metal ABC transporter permease [Clostridia bacterium]
MSLSEIFTNPFICKIVMRALIVGVLVSLSAALLGVGLVLKRFSMIGDGLSHVGFLAVAIPTVFASLVNFSLEISLIIVVLASFLIMRISQSTKINGDSAIALISTSAVAIGVIIFDFTTGMTTDICNNMFGSSSVLTLTDKDLYISIALSLICIGTFVFLYNKIFCYTFDESFAASQGIKIKRCQAAVSLMISVTIVIGMRLLGAIMISALTIFPALTAMMLCKTYKSAVVSSAIISVICFVIGFFAACMLSLQTGPAVIIVNLLAFAASVIIKKLKRA